MSTQALVAKVIEAYGGRTTLDSIKTVALVQALSVQGESGTITTTIEAPNKMLQVVSIPAYHATITTGFDGTNGWTSDAYGHVKALTGDQLTGLACQATNPFTTILHPDSTVTVTAQPDQTVGGKTYVILLLSKKDCPTRTFYLDPKTFLTARVDDGQQTHDLSDYDTGPLGEKYAKSDAVEGLGSVATVTSRKDNVPVDDSIFAMPKAAPDGGASPASPAPAPAAASPAPSPSPKRPSV